MDFVAEKQLPRVNMGAVEVWKKFGGKKAHVADSAHVHHQDRVDAVLAGGYTSVVLISTLRVETGTS